MSNQDTKNELNDYDLYISYNQKQKAQVNHICKLFKEADLKIWYDQEKANNTNSDNIFNSNLHALQSSYIFICFLSKDYQKSIKNRIEYSIAVEQNKKIINIYLDDFKSQLNEKKNKEDKSNLLHLNLIGLNLQELNRMIKMIKEEAETFSNSFKQSFRKLVNNWYNTVTLS